MKIKAHKKDVAIGVEAVIIAAFFGYLGHKTISERNMPEYVINDAINYIYDKTGVEMRTIENVLIAESKYLEDLGY